MPSLWLSLLSVCALAAEPLSPAQQIARFHSAMREGDKATVEAMLSPDLQVFEAGYVNPSRSDYLQHHLGDDMAYAKTSTTRVLQQKVVETPDMTLVLSETETREHGKAPVTFTGTETMVLKRVQGEWKITHIHWSSHRQKP